MTKKDESPEEGANPYWSDELLAVLAEALGDEDRARQTLEVVIQQAGSGSEDNGNESDAHEATSQCAVVTRRSTPPGGSKRCKPRQQQVAKEQVLKLRQLFRPKIK